MIDNLKKFLNEDQDPKAIEKVTSTLEDILMNGEEIEYIAVQKKPAINISPDCVVITNKRVLFCRPKNLGLSMDLQDYLWKDIQDCQLKEGMLGSEFTVQTSHGHSNKIDYLPKSQARKLYAVAQEQEEAQREISRQRDLEEKRASAQNLSISPNLTTTSSPEPSAEPKVQNNPQDEITAALQKLKSLWENGLINQAEFESKKAEILSRL